MPFEPDGVRPVYCTDCLSDLKNIKKKDSEQRKITKTKEIEVMKNKQTTVSKKVAQSVMPKKEVVIKPGNMVKSSEKKVGLYSNAKTQLPKENKIETSTDEAKPEISLSEAFQSGAVNFSGKKVQNTSDNKNHNRKFNEKSVNLETTSTQANNKIINSSRLTTNNSQGNNLVKPNSDDLRKTSSQMEEDKEINF